MEPATSHLANAVPKPTAPPCATAIYVNKKMLLRRKNDVTSTQNQMSHLLKPVC